MQITNRVCMLSEFCVSWLAVMFFHAHFKQVITWFLLQFGVIRTCKFFENYILHLPYRLRCNFVVLENFTCAYPHQITLEIMLLPNYTEYLFISVPLWPYRYPFMFLCDAARSFPPNLPVKNFVASTACSIFIIIFSGWTVKYRFSLNGSFNKCI